MRKYIILALGIFLMMPSIYSQSVQTWTEDFDGSLTNFTATPGGTPAGSWVFDPVNYLPGSSISNPRSYLGIVPNGLGNTTILQTRPYDFTGMVYVMLKFNQICKVSPLDTVLIQYQESGTSDWKNLPVYAYKGKATNYNGRGFNAASYTDWQAEDSTAIPQESWWKEEVFDLSEDLQYGTFTFRFVIKRGQTHGTQVSYGWLLENFEITASPYQLYLPVVEFIAPLVQDTAYGTGPWEINAKVKTSTKARIYNPWLIYTHTLNGISATDSVLMTMVRGDSLWKASIPKFVAGTEVSYSITGMDTTGNHVIITSKYIIGKGIQGEVIIGTGTLTSSTSPYYSNYNRSWTRAIYYDWELGLQGTGGLITSIAYYTAISGTTVDRLSMYCKAVVDNAVQNSYADPIGDGATLVWGEATHISYDGWNVFTFHTPFYLPVGHNLMVYWINDDGSYLGNGTTIYWNYTSSGTNNHIYAYSDPLDFPAMTPTRNSNRPNVKVNTINTNIGTNAASLYSIDMGDTSIISSGASIPVVVTVRNEGNLDLSSVRVYYSVNGAAATFKNVSITPSLPWNYVIQDNVGSYIPKVNGWDTLKIWVSLPNGQNDPIKTDDTLTKIIYGSSDIEMAFVNYPADTVTNTGTFAISARIRTLSGAPVGTVSLSVDTSCVGTPTNFTLPMTFDVDDGLYKTNIPHTLFGSDVKYSITKTDSRGNVVIIEKGFYIKAPTAERDTNAVVMAAINTPEAGGVLAGTTIPLEVTIRNKGVYNLTSCDIVWTLNGVPQSTYNWTGDLPEDFTRTIVIDNYTSPSVGQRDTIEVTVSMPNGLINSVTTDISLQVIVLACAGDLHGIKTVDSTTGDFVSISNAITAIRECNLSGDLTLQLKGVYRENVNLANLTPYMRGYSLTITSVDNHADSAVIQPASGVGITLGNTRNVMLTKITVNTTAITANTVQFTAACTNIVIRDCKLLVNPTTTTDGSPAAIYKGGNTGNVDRIFIINNLLDGGSTGLFFYGGTGRGIVNNYGNMGAEYGTNVIFDSNTCTNSSHYGLKVWYTDFLHISWNNISPRPTSTNRYDLFSFEYVNGDLIGNKLSCSSTQEVEYFHLSQYNWNNISKSRGLIANNEIIHTSPGVSLFMYHNTMYSEIVHNSFYASSATSTNSRGIYWEGVGGSSSYMRNNNIVINAPGGLISVQDVSTYTLPGGGARYDIDYCNLYHSATFNLAAFKQSYTGSQNVVSIMPDYVDINVSAEVKVENISVLSAPILPAITHDIVGKPRTGQATMGAYQIVPYTLDLGLNQFISLNTEAVKDQTVSINIEVQNTGSGNIQNAVFGWSINGVSQTSIPWTPTTPLAFIGKDNVSIGSFTVGNTDSYNIVVWLESVNNAVDMYHTNDTLRVVVNRMPLAEWVAPFVEDTLYQLTFDVNAKIRTITGAPITPPELTFITIINDKYTLYDTLPMRLNNGVWQVSIPQQYYGSNVIYSLTVSDNEGNTLTITDSVYLKFLGVFGITNPALTIGTGTNYSVYNPYYHYYNYSHSRNYYLDYEINPKRTGGMIRSIAFYNSYTSDSSRMNGISFYLKAVSDSTISQSSYVDPIGDGATLVWGPARWVSIPGGWNVFTLHAPFYLEEGKHLLIYCNNEDGSYSDNGTNNWEYTTVSFGNSSYYVYEDNAFPPVSTYNTSTSGNRPNLQLDIYGSSKYSGNNLAITGILNPVNDQNELCSPNYSPVQVVITNMGENDYNLTQDSIVVSLELINSLGTKYEASLVLDIGTFNSGASDTLELMSALPIMYSGMYNIKVWLTNSIDNLPYDDTLVYDYISGRIGLPIDEDFSNASLPIQFVVTSQVGGSPWTPYTPNISDPVQPGQGNGTGVLRFNGTAGAMTMLSTRQLDLFGSDQPQLEFWYFHDTTLPFTDLSYLDVNAILGGVPINLAHLLQRRDVGHGWQYYNFSLNQFTTSSQCLLIQFEAMNKNGNPQYIDRIRITAQQDIAITGVVADYSACDMQNKEWKVILSNLTSPVLDYSNTPTGVVLEVAGTPYTFTKSLQTGFVNGFTSDTIAVSPTFNFTKGTYQVKAYLSTPVDNVSRNDTVVTTLVINPSIEVRAEKLSGGSHMGGEAKAFQTVVVENTGNMELSDITLVMQIDTGESIQALYSTLTETYTGVIPIGETITYTFNSPYIVPWSTNYYVGVTASLACDFALANDKDEIIESVDMKDLYIAGISSPTAKDTIGNSIQVTATLINRSDVEDFRGVDITVLVTNSQGAEVASFMEAVDIVDHLLSTKNYTFSNSYTVPSDPEYYLTVYTKSYDAYSYNDTLTVKRETVEKEEVSIMGINGEVFTLGQNIPNPANSSTRINYSIPEAGEVIFHVHSVSGQLLYSQTIETVSGKQSIELNTSTFAAGIYFYSIEYKGQRLVKRMMIND